MMERAAEYRAKIAEIRERGGPRWRAPEPFREEIVSWASNLRSAGHGAGAIAAAIGVCDSTLRRWLAPSEAKGELRPVRVGGAAAGSKAGALVVVSPAGYRLEGLDVDLAVEILRRL